MVRSAVRITRHYEAMTAPAGACCEVVAERMLRKWNQTLKMAPPPGRFHLLDTRLGWVGRGAPRGKMVGYI